MRRIASRKDTRIIDLLIAFGPAGYGIYVMLVEYLGMRKAMRSRGDIARIAYELHSDAETVRSVLEDFNLFDCTASGYYNRGKAPAETTSETMSEPEAEPMPAENAPEAETDVEAWAAIESEAEAEADNRDDGGQPDAEPMAEQPAAPTVSASMKRRERRKRLRLYRMN